MRGGLFKTKKMLKSFLAAAGATIRIGREIQCLPYAGFFFTNCNKTFISEFMMVTAFQISFKRDVNIVY